MKTKDNHFSKAMYDMFGVGSTSEAVETKTENTAPIMEKAAPVRAKAVTAEQHTYLAPGTVLEGTLHTKGDVVIAGTFKGDIAAEGNVTLQTSVTGNVTARSMTLTDCTLTGQCVVTGKMDIKSASAVQGNIKAEVVLCSGTVDGDIEAAGDVRLESSARVKGNITAGSLSVERGAVIEGKLTVAS